MNYLAELNSSQLAAANWNEGPLLVLAGPGSGKTKTLISRVARLVDESEDESYRILCLTFTRKAAAEMRDRLFTLVPDAKKRVNLSTFHSFATDILRQHGSYYGLTPDFSIIDKEEQISNIKKIIEENEYKYSAFISAEKALNAIEYLFKELVPDEKVPSLVQNPETGIQLKLLFQEYKERLCSLNSLDYGAIIYLCEQILRERPRLARQLRSVYRYICIDEFQDTNNSQYELLRALAPEENSNVFIVGDDDQIIYQWNGASPKRIEILKSNYDLKQIQLPENYRCPSEVVLIANKLILNNELRVQGKKELLAMRATSTSSPIELQGFSTEVAEQGWIAQQIKGKLEQGVKPSDIVVLARNTKLLQGVADALSKEEIEAFVPQRKTSFESAPLRLMLESLKLSLIRTDQEILSKLVKALDDCFGIGFSPNEIIVSAAETSGDYFKAFLNALRALPEEHASNIFELLECIDKNGHWAFISKAFLMFNKLSKEAIENANGEEIEAFSEYFEEANVWRNIVEEIGSQHEAESLSLGQLLQEIALANKSLEPPQSAIRCFTIHASKGMEFPHVFLVGLVEDQLPSFQAKKKGSDSYEMQEERRNCFVAITRTKESLTLTYAKQYNGWSKNPSRFLYEMGLLTN